MTQIEFSFPTTNLSTPNAWLDFNEDEILKYFDNLYKLTLEEKVDESKFLENDNYLLKMLFYFLDYTKNIYLRIYACSILSNIMGLDSSSFQGELMQVLVEFEVVKKFFNVLEKEKDQKFLINAILGLGNFYLERNIGVLDSQNNKLFFLSYLRDNYDKFNEKEDRQTLIWAQVNVMKGELQNNFSITYDDFFGKFINLLYDETCERNLIEILTLLSEHTSNIKNYISFDNLKAITFEVPISIKKG